MTIGLSPKVQAFLAAVGGPGLLLLILGLVIGDDTLKTAGLSLLAGSAVGGAAGYKAPPGEVIVERGPASDELLSGAALEGAEAGTPPSAD